MSNIEVSYYPGCSLHATAEIYDVQIKLVFEKMGVKINELEDWSCCGATSAAKTDDFLAIALPTRNIGIAEASGLKDLVIPCSSCYSRTLVAQKRINADTEIKESINEELRDKVSTGVNVLSIMELMERAIKEMEFPEGASEKLKNFKAACYYGCLMTRFPCDMDIEDDVENPQSIENVLESFGATSIDWAFKTDCCGASASVNDADVSIDLMAKIFKDAIARDANCIVTTCPMCQFNLDAYQSAVASKHGITKKLPVYYLTELVGIALGLDPVALHVDRHLVDAMSLIKELV
jgi:heterodisulfide reductase subunit B